MAHEFTDDNFDAEVLKSSEPVLVDFWAPWCGPCRMMGPVMDNLVKEFEGKPVKIGKVNVDENSVIAERFGILSIPTFMMFKNGASVAQSAGAQTIEELKALIAKAQ